MDREANGRYQFRMQAVKWAVAKLQGDKTALLAAGRMSGPELQGTKSASQSSMEL